MDKNSFEGSAVLEKLAEAGRLDEFYEAVDSDDFELARKIMMGAGIAIESIEIVLQKMADADGEH